MPERDSSEQAARAPVGRSRHVVATVAEVPPGARKLVEVAGRSIGIFNVGGRYFAVRNRCPHQGGPLCLGRQIGLTTSERPGEYRYERVGEILRCPWHGWEFDLDTGQSIVDPLRTRVRSYPVEVETLQAEVYPVEVEHDVIVVLL